MGEIKWIKLSTDIFNNRKIRQIECMPDGDTIIVIWFKILALAGEINDSGQVYLTKEIPYTEQLLATQFNRPIATVRLALQTFQQFGMIEIIDNLILVSNWEKYQNMEGMERVREQNRLRKQAQRERERLLLSQSRDSHAMSRDSHAGEEEKERDIYNTTTTTLSFSGASESEPPSFVEIAQYFVNGSTIDVRNPGTEAEKFRAYNELRGWDCLPNWKAAADLWIARSGDFAVG